MYLAGMGIAFLSIILLFWLQNYLHVRELRQSNSRHEAQLLVLAQSAVVSARANNAIEAAHAQQVFVSPYEEPGAEEVENNEPEVTGLTLDGGNIVDFMTHVPDDIIKRAENDAVWVRGR